MNPPAARAARSPVFWVPTLYFAEGLPFYAVALIAGLMYKKLGVPNDQIARWTALIGLAWVFKPLWSPLLEAAPTKKSVVVIFQGLGAAALFGVALCLQTPIWFPASIAVLAVAAVAAATHDIAADGLYIASLSARQQAGYAGWQGAFFNAAKFIATGGLVILAGQLEAHMSVTEAWSIIFGLSGATMAALAMYHLWALPPAHNALAQGRGQRAIWSAFSDVIVDFFRKPGIGMAILFVILFRAGEGQIQTIGPLFLLDARSTGGLGLATDAVGWIYGTVGSVAFLVGSVCGGYFASFLGLRRAMPFLILAVNLPNLVYLFLSSTQPEARDVIAAALGVEMFGYGFGFVGVILFIMQVIAVGRYQTAHYALGTGVMQLGLVLFKFISGDVQKALGYRDFFVWVLICGLPVFALSWLIRDRLPGAGPAPVATSDAAPAS